MMEQCQLPHSDTNENRKMVLEGLVDLLTLSLILRTNSIRDIILKSRDSIGQKLTEEDQEKEMQSFRNDIPVMQQHIVRWIQSSVVRNFQLSVDEVTYWLRRDLFIDLNPAKNLSDYDPWPQEPDKTILVNTVTSCNLQQGTLMRLAFIATESNHAVDGLDFIWKLVQRCCQSG